MTGEEIADVAVVELSHPVLSGPERAAASHVCSWLVSLRVVCRKDGGREIEG